MRKLRHKGYENDLRSYKVGDFEAETWTQTWVNLLTTYYSIEYSYRIQNKQAHKWINPYNIEGMADRLGKMILPTPCDSQFLTFLGLYNPLSFSMGRTYDLLSVNGICPKWGVTTLSLFTNRFLLIDFLLWWLWRSKLPYCELPMETATWKRTVDVI